MFVSNHELFLGERGYTFPYELAPRGEPGIDGIPGFKGKAIFESIRF